jgi:4-amino-4-deoxy-L-arabinose transferase-like glycosyltransferase
MLTQVRTGSASVARTEPTRPAIPIETWALAAIVALGAILRLATLTSQSYWSDEATTVHEVHLSLGALWHAVRVNESSPPLYFFTAWPWAKLFGTSEAALRSLSALFGIGLIPVAYLCGRELVSRRAGLLTAALVAVNPFMIWYSQEARAYMMFATLCALSLLFFARARRTRSPRDLAAWAVCSALALLTHFFGGFLVVPEAVWLLVAVRRRATLLAVAVVAAVQAALLPLALSDTSHPLQGWIGQFPLSIRLEQVPIDFALSSLYQSTIVNHALLLTLALAAVVIALLIAGGDRAGVRGAFIAAALAGVVILVPLVLAALGSDYLVARNVIPAWLPLAIVLAAACTGPRIVPAGAALAVLLIGAFLYGTIYIERTPQYQRPDWRGVAAALGPATGERAIAVYDGPFGAQPLSIYLPRAPWGQSTQPVEMKELDIVGNPWQVLRRPLPAGITLISSRIVHEFVVDRFALAGAGWSASPADILARAGALLYPAPAGAAVLVQHPHPA